MAAAQERQRHAERTRIEMALRRIDEGEWGVCEECGRDIPQGRMEIDPAATLCVDCKQRSE